GRLNLYNAIQALISSEEIIKMDTNAYSHSGDITITLFDSDLAGNTTQDITISADTADTETVTLDELTASPGIFKGSIALDSSVPDVNDGLLQVADGALITASYGTAVDTADVDCQFPVISNVQLNMASMPIITFDTDEPATASVRAGSACGDYYLTATDPSLRTNHEVELRFLDPNTVYYFVIDAIDPSGNLTTDSNNGCCFNFTSVAPLRVPSEYSTIQAAIDDANDGDTILVADGNYTGPGNRDIEFNGKSITLKSKNGPQNC
ncbi:unnamed protein product, partial [marine sediment metagenome]